MYENLLFCFLCYVKIEICLDVISIMILLI